MMRKTANRIAMAAVIGIMFAAGNRPGAIDDTKTASVAKASVQVRSGLEDRDPRAAAPSDFSTRGGIASLRGAVGGLATR